LFTATVETLSSRFDSVWGTTE